MRIRLSVKRRSASAAPTIDQTPVITSAEPGVYKVGVLLTCSTPNTTPADATLAFQWVNASGLVAIPGATSASYLPTADVEGLSLRCRVTASVFGASSGPTYAVAVGPILEADEGTDPSDPPDPTSAYAGVDPETLEARAAFVARFAGRWARHTNQPFYTDILVSSVAALDAAYDALDVSDLSRWHRIRLDSTAPAANWTAGLTLGGSVESTNPILALGHLYGGDRDRATAGGGVVIESSDPNNPPMLTGTMTLRGARGVHLRSIRSACASAAGIIITKHSLGGTGVRYPEAPVVCIEDCDLGAGWDPSIIDKQLYDIAVHVTGHAEQLDVFDNRLKGNENGFQVSEGTFIRTWGNDFQIQSSDVGSVYAKSLSSSINSSFSDLTLVWRRGNTGRNWANNPGSAAEHCDIGQHGAATNVQNTLCLYEFEAFQQGQPEACRDYVRLSRTGKLNVTDGVTLTIAGVTFTFRTTPTLATEIQIGSTLSASNANAKNHLLAYEPAITNLENGLSTSSYVELHFPIDLLPASASMTGATVARGRLRGGMQGWQNGDIGPAYRIDGIAVNCLFTCLTNAATLYTGSWIMDRCTLARVHQLAPVAEVGVAGFSDTGEDDILIKSGRNSGTAILTTHKIRNSVFSYVADLVASGTTYDADGPYVRSNATLVLANNRYVRWEASAPSEDRADTLLAGDIALDVGGRLAYSMQNDGLNTQQAFREEMYSILKLANAGDAAAIGVVNPASWGL